MTQEKKPGLIRRVLMGFIRWVNLIRLVLVNLIFIALLLFIASLFFSSEKMMPTIPEKAVLKLDIAGTVVEEVNSINALQMFGSNNPREQEVKLQDIIDAIDFAKNDDRIQFLYLNVDNLVYAGISKISEISPALEAFKASGKKIIAYGDSYTQDGYLLASYADEVYLHPMGGVLLQGYGVYRNYMKDAIDKLSIDFHIFRVGEFKSALEPLFRTSMSQEAKEANQHWLGNLWQQYQQQLENNRKLPVGTLNNYINNIDKNLQEYQGSTSTLATAMNLVDGIKTHQQIDDYLIKLLGVKTSEDEPQAIGFKQFLALKRFENKLKPSAKEVGVIIASGNIMDGKQPPGTIGSTTVTSLIRKAVRDDSIAALVLRVDSGGGSAFASEVIRNELLNYKKTGRPLVISMGSAAASGGYWISADADEIWATPATITGSIGIFGAYPSFNRSLEKMGVYNDGVGTTVLAGALRPERALPPTAANAIQSTIEHGYRQFINIVAEGRELSSNRVESLAQGRVWSGETAKTLGLVDELGGLDDAVKAAANLAGLEKASKRYIKRDLTPQEQLLEALAQLEPVSFHLRLNSYLGQSLRWLQPVYVELQSWQQLNDPMHSYALCSYCVAP